MEDDGKGRCSPVPSTSTAALDIQHLSEFRARSTGNETDSTDRKDWIRRYIMNYRSDISPDQLEHLWTQVTEMVGFFSEPVPSGGGGGGGGDNNADVRRVVCSPDLPLPAASGVPDGGGTGPAVANEHRCLVCNKHFASRGALLTHQRTHAPPPPQQQQQQQPQQKGGAAADPYQCNVCNKTFAVPARLSRHYRTHTGERPFQCDFCDKKFGVKENLSVHRRIHTKERPYKCEVCARAFEHSGKLHRHMRIHTGERPHRCTVCGKTFIQSGQLVIHTRTHTGEKPYVCNVCRKGFTCSKQLKVHSRTHTGEKPYACDICGKAFGYNHVLKLHQVAHYGEKVYKCTLCHDTFTSKKTMEAHIKSHSEGAISPVSQPTASQPEPSTSLPTGDVKNVIAKEEYLPTTSAQHQPHIQQTSDSYKHSESYYNYPKSERTSEYSIQQIDYVPQPMSGVDPALLAAAAVAANEDKSAVRIVQQKQPLAESSPSYIAFAPSSEPSSYYPPLDRCDNIRDIRRRVEAALAATEDEQDPLYITPPSSAPVSPAPSSSPEPAELILPMRKRSKAILQSMEREDSPVVSAPVVRYSSVIQYARAS